MGRFSRLVSLTLILSIVLPVFAVFTPMTSATACPVFSDEELLPYATTQRIVLAELFTATWCGYCPYATQAINKLAEEYGSGKLVVLQYHPSGSDPFGISETDARISYYAITGYPTMIFDGTIKTVGGWEGAYDSYNATIKSELQESSDVSISLVGSLTDFTANVTVSSSIQSTSAKVRFVVYEDDISYDAPNGEKIFRFTVRMILNEQALTLASGQTVSIRRTFQPQVGWNITNLGLVVFVQKDDTHEILQAVAFLKSTAFSLNSSGTTAKTVQPNETVTFEAQLTNTGTLDDNYSLTLTKSLPSGWIAEFCVGNMCYLNSTIISVKSGCLQNITINIVTSASAGSGTATLTAVSQRDPAKTCSVVFTASVGGIQIDLNKDGTVDIQDIAIVAIAFGSKPGDSSWNQAADLNRDGVIDIVDITMVAVDYGKTV